MSTYSFQDVVAAINIGDGKVINVSPGGVAEEGITFERNEDANTMLVGTEGEVLHCLHSGTSGTVRLRLLKTSGKNGELMNALNEQQAQGAKWGRNLISLEDKARGDKVVATEVAFAGKPVIVFAKIGAIMEWAFHAGRITAVLQTDF